MKILVGALDRDGGNVELEGALGYCPQELVLYDRLTRDEHFELFGTADGMTGHQMERARDEIYDLRVAGRHGR